VSAPTITWTHQTLTADETGIAWSSFAMPTAMKYAGGWAEDARENGASFITPHYSCTPTSYTSHTLGTGVHPQVAQHAEYDSPSDTTYLRIGFACPPGQQVRAHLFTVS
jgi:hypothetical protein